MNKEQIDNLLKDKNINLKEKLDILYKEYYTTCFNIGYYKEKANILASSIEELKKEYNK